jgi:hypothetical protein
MIKRFFKKRIQEIEERFQGNDIIISSDQANFFGQLSKGHRQIRGMGVLILLKEKLYFEMWQPKKNLEIKTSDIKSIENPQSFLSKSKFRDLLRINFINEIKENDAAAWLISDLDSWNQEIKKLIKN